MTSYLKREPQIVSLSQMVINGQVVDFTTPKPKPMKAGKTPPIDHYRTFSRRQDEAVVARRSDNVTPLKAKVVVDKKALSELRAAKRKAGIKKWRTVPANGFIGDSLLALEAIKKALVEQREMTWTELERVGAGVGDGVGVGDSTVVRIMQHLRSIGFAELGAKENARKTKVHWPTAEALK